MHHLRSTIITLAISASVGAGAAELAVTSASLPGKGAATESVRKLQAELSALSRRKADARTDEEREEVARELRALLKKVEEARLQSSPRTRYASPGMMAPEIESYGQAVLSKIESIGTKNFPKKNGKSIYGKTSLTFAIASSGAIEYVEVLHSSGNKEIDAHAVSVVRRAAPFSRFAQNLARDIDRIVFSFPFTYANEPEQ